MPRFLVRDLRPGLEVALPPDESLHALRSLRLGPGDRVTLFDGAGTTCPGEIVRIDGDRVIARAGAAGPPLPSSRIVIASALPKGRRLAWMVQKLSALGVAEFIPVRFRRSVVRWTPSKGAKLEKIAAEAAKQCGRAELMVLRPETEVVALAGRGAVYVADPSGGTTLARSLQKGVESSTVVIGPEGGLAPGELEALGGIRVSLGPTILRIETAAVAAASVLAQQ